MDTIGEFLTRIRNASQARHEKVDVPASNLRQGIAKVLKETGYIQDFKVVKDGKQGMMRIYLKYRIDGKPRIEALERVSRPGRRKYASFDDIPKVRSGYGLAVITTSKGVMSSKEAVERKLGGEIICRAW